jgi:hypothetical protein
MTTSSYTISASIEPKTGIDSLTVRDAAGNVVGSVRYPGGLHAGVDTARVLAAVASILPPRTKLGQHCGRLMYVVGAAD